MPVKPNPTQARAAVEEGVRIFETAGNNRALPYQMVETSTRTNLSNIFRRVPPRINYSNVAGPLIKFFKSQGCFVIHKCTTIRHAKVCVI
jgi:hypothetical protein